MDAGISRDSSTWELSVELFSLKSNRYGGDANTRRAREGKTREREIGEEVSRMGEENEIMEKLYIEIGCKISRTALRAKDV